MGQSVSSSIPTPESIIEDTVDTIQYEIKKHAQNFREINSLTYEEFNSCLSSLNDLSRNCLDSNGKITVFAVKKGTDLSFLWKATVRIACVKCDPQSHQIETYKFINLKQFLKVFNTFQSHLEVMSSCEEQHDKARSLTALLTNVTQLSPVDEQSARELAEKYDSTECCICLDRKPDLILPCAHVFCSTCIEQWNATHKKCPICQAKLNSTDDTWVLSELPQADEVNDKILNELNALTKASDSEADNDDHDDDD